MWLVAVQSYLNVPMDRLKELAIAQMQEKLSGLVQIQVSNRKAGILATDVYDFEAGMDIHLTQDKVKRRTKTNQDSLRLVVTVGRDITG